MLKIPPHILIPKSAVSPQEYVSAAKELNCNTRSTHMLFQGERLFLSRKKSLQKISFMNVTLTSWSLNKGPENQNVSYIKPLVYDVPKKSLANNFDPPFRALGCRFTDLGVPRALKNYCLLQRSACTVNTLLVLGGNRAQYQKLPNATQWK